jgi:hypothetical protein
MTNLSPRHVATIAINFIVFWCWGGKRYWASTFVRLFRARTGRTPHAYLLQLRIDAAKPMLAATCSTKPTPSSPG